MNEEEIEELEDFTIDVNDIDELALGLEVCSKKSNMVIQEFADLIIKLQQENKQLKEKMIQLHCYLGSGDFESNFESINNEVYIRAKIKDIIGLTMSEEEFEILKNRYFKIDVRPSFTTRKLKEAEEQLYKIKNLIGSYDEISTLENEIYKIIGDSK